MKLEKRSAAFLGGAGFLLVVILALPARNGSDDLAVPVPAHPPPAAPAAGGRDEGALLVEQRRRSSELAWTRDPFAPAPARAPALPASNEPVPALGYSLLPPVLTGVSIRGDDRRAVLDHEIVQEGDRLTSGYTVAKITARSVTLLREHEELTLCLGEEP